MNVVPKISDYMTPMAKTIGEDIELTKAIELMRINDIRHLPVLHGGQLVGILSDRNVQAASLVEGIDFKVGDIMFPDPYKVDVETPLEEVAKVMQAEKYGCAVVCEGNGKVAGIFTTVDALGALRECLRWAAI